MRTERQTNFEEKLQKAHADVRLRPGHRLRRPDGGDRRGRAAEEAQLRTSWLYRLTHAINTTPSLYLGPAPSTAACSCKRIGRSSTWRMSAAITPSTRSQAGCSVTANGRGQDLLHDRPPHLRDGDQDGAHGHPDPGLALRLHRLGRRARAQGRADADRPRQGQALPRPRPARIASSSTRTSPMSTRRARSTGARGMGIIDTRSFGRGEKLIWSGRRVRSPMRAGRGRGPFCSAFRSSPLRCSGSPRRPRRPAGSGCSASRSC